MTRIRLSAVLIGVSLILLSSYSSPSFMNDRGSFPFESSSQPLNPEEDQVQATPERDVTQELRREITQQLRTATKKPPKTTLVSNSIEVRKPLNHGSKIYQTWAINGEKVTIDRSSPPVDWPSALRAPAGNLSLVFSTAVPPTNLEIRLWSNLRSNGLPKGKQKILRCGKAAPDPTGCVLDPVRIGGYLNWEAVFRPPPGEMWLIAQGDFPNPSAAFGGGGVNSAAWQFHVAPHSLRRTVVPRWVQ